MRFGLQTAALLSSCRFLYLRIRCCCRPASGLGLIKTTLKALVLGTRGEMQLAFFPSGINRPVAQHCCLGSPDIPSLPPLVVRDLSQFGYLWHSF